MPSEHAQALYDLAKRTIGDPSEHFSDTERALAKLELGWAKAALGLRKGVRFNHDGGHRGLSLFAVLRILEVYRQRYEAGDTLSILSAVKWCAEENLPLPRWLAKAFIAGLDSYLDPTGPTGLDDVFASPTIPTNTAKKKAAALQDWDLGLGMWACAWGLALEDELILSFDALVLRVLAKQSWGVKSTKAKELIQDVERNQNNFLNAISGGVERQGFAAFFEKRRKGST